MTIQPFSDPQTLLHAYIDGELGPVDALEFERMIEADQELRAQRDRIVALRQVLREGMRPRQPPAELRRRIERTLNIRRSVAASPSWRALAASIALVAIVSSASTWFLAGPGALRSTEDAIVADHIRALMAPQPADVASTDQHTVKPWFNGRVPQSPTVVDLAGEGFPLIGGRIDVISREPVPTLVYRRRKHVIDLTAIPAPRSQNSSPAFNTNDGYNIVRWVENGVAYWAISDVAPTDLKEFVSLFRSRAG